jgi:recombination protein RecA
MLKLSGGEPIPVSEVIETPSFGLNHVLGGGLWTGRFSLMWGNPSSGKTTFLLHVMAEAQRRGYTPVIIDAEGSYTDPWAEKCGIDIDTRLYFRSNIWEHIKKEIVPIMKKDEKFIFLFDSVNAISSEDWYNDKGGMASDARTRRKIFQELAEYLHPANNAVLMVSQQTLDFSGTYPVMTAKIGNAEQHWCTNIIRLFGSGAKDKLERGANELIVNKEVSWTIQKSKQAPVEGTKGSYWFSPQTASIDKKREIIHIAVANGVGIRKSGAWYYVGDEKYQGMDNLVEAIDDDQIVLIQKELENTEITFEVEDD